MKRRSSCQLGACRESEVAERFRAGFVIVGMGEVADGGAEQFLGRAPEDLHHGVVHTEELAVERHERHADRRVLERAAEPLLSFSQLRFRVPAVGDVARAHHEAGDRRVVHQVRAHRLDGSPPAVGVVHAELDPVARVRIRCRDVERVQRDREVVRMHEIEGVRADERVGVEAEDALGRGARVGEVAPVVDDRHDVARVAHHRAGSEPRSARGAR